MLRSTARSLNLLILVGLLAGLCACQRALRSPAKIDPDIAQIRLQYRERFPDDPFYAAIASNKLMEGMNPTQVFLAWGRPVKRIKSGNEQKWVYEFSEDPEAQPKTIAHLFFINEKLIRWKMDRGYVYLLDAESGGDSDEYIEDLPDLGPSKQP